MSSLSNTNYNARSMNGLINVNANTGTFTDLEVNNLTINQSGIAPTMPSTDNSTHIATTAFVQSHTSGAYVTLGTNQSISGEKTFTNANTFITGNLVCNSLQADNSGNNINIGTQLYTGDINMGTTASSGQNVALNWGTSSNTGQLTFRGGSFNFSSTGVVTMTPGAAQDTNISNNQTSGILNIGNNATRNISSSINIGSSSSAATTNIGGGIINVNAGSNININSSATAGNYNIGTSGSTTGTINIGTAQTTGQINIGTNAGHSGAINIGASGTSNPIFINNVRFRVGEITSGTGLLINSTISGNIDIGNTQEAGSLNIGTNATRTTGTINIGSTATTANMNLNCGGTLTVNGNTSFTNIPICSVVPTTVNDLTNKSYVDSVSGTGLLSSNNAWTGTNTFNGTFAVNQVLASDMDFTVASHTDRYNFNFVGAPSTSAQLKIAYVNGLSRVQLNQFISGKGLSLALGGSEYVICNPSTTYCDIPKLSTGFVDYTLNTINARSGYSMSLGLNGTNMITLDNTTSKVLLAPTRCASYLEVVGEIQANNPIELTYNPSSLSAGRLGFQYYSTSTTTPTTGGSKNITFSGTGLDYFTLPTGVWLCELYSGWAQTSNNRAISLSATSATVDNSRACYSTQQNSSYQELTFTTALSVTDSSVRYYFVIQNGSNTGSYSSIQHYLRITRIA